MRKDIEFYSEGSLIKGHLYLPDSSPEDGPSSAIIMCHGFAGVKELLLPNFAEKFCDNGYLILTFDYRGFGESEGESGRLVPREQIVDIRNAITFTQSLQEVDSEKIGLWGTSLGGANAIAVAHSDKRVKCLVVQLAFGDGERVILGDKSAEEKEKTFATIQKIWTKIVTQNKGMVIGINKFLTDAQSQAFYKDYVEVFPQLKIKIPFLTMKEIIEHKPERLLHAMDTPILIVGAENDAVNPKEESSILFEKVKGPKQLEIIKGATHYEIYEGEKCEQAAALELEWFNKFLN